MNSYSTIRSQVELLLFSLCISVVAGLPTIIRTSTTVAGHVNNGRSVDLVCKPTKWTDVAQFFLGNYVAHVATVRAAPGLPLPDKIVTLLLALFFPQTGVINGLNAIFRRAVFAKSPLHIAARAGALCMVVRTFEWRPRTGDRIRCFSFMDTEVVDKFVKDKLDFIGSFNPKPEAELRKLRNLKEPLLLSVGMPPWMRRTSRMFWSYTDSGAGLFVPWGRELHGVCRLPLGYALAVVPRQAMLSETRPKEHGAVETKADEENEEAELESQWTNTISASFSMVKALVAVLQTLYASITLYSTRGSQLDRYGYAAFGLTVAPYLVMSLINLIGNLVTPEYPAVYMVGSDIMEEARGRGAVIDGEVGHIVPEDTSAWSSGVPNELSVTFVSAGQDRIGLTDVTYSSMKDFGPEENELQTMAGAPSGNEDNPIRTSAASGPNGGSGSKMNEISSSAEQEDQETPIEVKVAPLDKSLASKPEPFLVVPCCNNFAFTEQLMHNVPVDGSGKKPLLYRPRSNAWYSILSLYGWSFGISAVSVAIIGGLSHFHSGNSTTAQRVWTMLWLSLGILWGPNSAIYPSATGLMKTFSDKRKKSRDPNRLRHFAAYNILVSALYTVPAIGGFVVVGQMLYEYGSCVNIG